MGTKLLGTAASDANDAIRKSELDAAIAGVSGATWTAVEVDFGTNPITSKRFTITDAAVTGASKIIVVPSGVVATSRVGDDWEWDSISFAAKPASGSFTVSALASGRIRGKRTIQYQVS